MEAVAKLRNVPTSPRKMRLVADLVRGLGVSAALNILKFEAKHGAEKIEKTLLSAIANWQVINEGERVEDANLYVKTIMVDCGRQLKRLRPAPQGRAHRIRKRSNHITIIVDTKPAMTKGGKLRNVAAQPITSTLSLDAAPITAAQNA
jgi:large subunit ribosomal protein L22